MVNDVFTQQALAADARFLIRVRAALITHALIVLAEAPPVPVRVAFARAVLNDPTREVQRVAPILVMRPNVMAFATSYNFATGTVDTTSGGPDIAAQIASDWNLYAGV